MLCEMHVLLLGYRPALKKNLNFVFLFIRKGYKVFSSLRYENDLLIHFYLNIFIYNFMRKIIAIGGGEIGRPHENGGFYPIETTSIDK